MPRDLLQGTLDLLILKTLAWEPMHGYAIARWLEHQTGNVLRIEEGSLYPGLRRLEGRGWVAGKWGVTETGRKARVYTLTREGRRQLTVETEAWGRFAEAMGKVLSVRPA